MPVPARPPSETMPTSGSSSRSSAIRCSAQRPWRPNASRSPRTSWSCLSGVTRPSALPRGRQQHDARCGTAGRGRGAGRAHLSRTARRHRRRSTSSSAIPVQPDSTASSARYSSACRPTADALTRIGRSLETRVTSLPSPARLRATARMRESLSPSRKPGGQRRRVGVVELDAQGAADVADRHRRVEPAVLDPQVVEQPQRLAGEVAELGVVPLGLQLGDHDDREHDLVLGEAQQARGSASRTRGVENVRAGPAGRALADGAVTGHVDSPQPGTRPGSLAVQVPGPGPRRGRDRPLSAM